MLWGQKQTWLTFGFGLLSCIFDNHSLCVELPSSNVDNANRIGKSTNLCHLTLELTLSITKSFFSIFLVFDCHIQE